MTLIVALAIRVMTLLAVSCHASTAAPPPPLPSLAAKLEIWTLIEVAAGCCEVSTLLMMTSVRALSEDRTEAKAERASGSGTEVETLRSPKVDFFPS